MNKFNPRTTILLVFIVLVATMRVLNSAQLTAVANFSPIGAMGLFGGSYFTNKWKAFLLPLLSLFISDIIINAFIFKGQYGIMYSGWYWVYGIFVLITWYGKTIISKASVKNLVAASLLAAVSHWLLADLSVWLSGGIDLRTMTPLTKDWAGLLQCYKQGFPFMRNFLAGTLAYSGVMFGAFEFMKIRFPQMVLVNRQS